jgi:hypothetical protein
MLALRDPAGEADAVAPLDPFRARQILTDPDDGLLASITAAPVEPSRRRESREDGRALLNRLGADPGRTRGMLRCPSHPDRHASLSWALGDDGRALVYCHAGCDFASILAAAT